MARPMFPWQLLVAIPASLVVGQAAAAPACTVLTQQDAATLAGVPLPENFKKDSQPTSENGHDKTSVCGWFPKGYKLATASLPPERGVQVSIHTFRTPAEAKTFHNLALEMAQESARAASPNSKVAAIGGVGESAFVDQKQFSGVYVATARFLKGINAVQLQVWVKGASATETAAAAAKQAIAKL